MKLLRLLNQTSPWVIALMVVAVAEIYAVVLLCRRRFGMDRLSLNNEVAGFKFAVVGVFYAVLLAFVVVAVWEDYRDTETAVRNEAKALSDLHQVSHALPGDIGVNLRGHLASYIEKVRDSEWPAMAHGRPSPDAHKELQQLNQTIFQGEADQLKDAEFYRHTLDLRSLATTAASASIAPMAPCRACSGSCCWQVPWSRSATRRFSARRIWWRKFS